ncbi:hypothetical protein [Psychromonas ingrahamii]
MSELYKQGLLTESEFSHAKSKLFSL